MLTNVLLCYLFVFSVNLTFYNISCAKRRYARTYHGKKSTKEDENKLVIFQLDHTCWPFRVDTDIEPPLTRKLKVREAFDVNRKIIKAYKDTFLVFDVLRKKKYVIGVHNHVLTPKLYNEVLEITGLKKFINFQQLNTDHEITQIKRMSDAANIPLKDIIYFGCNEAKCDNLTIELQISTFVVHPETGVDLIMLNKVLTQKRRR